MNKVENTFISPADLEKQENLSISKVKVTLNLSIDESTRPKESFIDLMKWTRESFKSNLKDTNNLNLFINNRIIVDGQFMYFCQLNNAEVSVLYKDSIVSWKTDNNFEKYFVQGVFLIKYKGLEFIHAALFHKGNQNEDEISFFVVVSDSNYEKYIEFRNSFDDWVSLRDRSNLHIHVVDGEDIPYEKDSSWEDLFLPNEIKNEIRALVEGFLNNKDFYISNKIPWKRGILLFGDPGNGKSSIIKTILSNYDFKPVTITPAANDEVIREAFSYAESQNPSLLYFEDLDSLLERSIDASSFLNLMDGISSKNGLLVIATANEIHKLKSNITDRPSRFDRKFEIPLPDQKMTLAYLKKWFSNLLTPVKARELSKLTVKYKFSYAYLKELYISSMFEALSNNKKVPTEDDIYKSLERIMKDKNIIRAGRSINTDKYFSK